MQDACMKRFWKLYWVLFAITFGLYLTMVFWALPRISNIAGGMTAFDLQPFGYDVQYAHSFLNALFENGPSGRDFYLNVQHRLDMAYPAAMGLFFIITIHAFSTGVNQILRLCLMILPLLSCAFDYAENYYVSIMLRKLPDLPSEAEVNTANLMTMFKSGFITVSVIAMIILILRALVKKTAHRGTIM